MSPVFSSQFAFTFAFWSENYQVELLKFSYEPMLLFALLTSTDTGKKGMWSPTSYQDISGKDSQVVEGHGCLRLIERVSSPRNFAFGPVPLPALWTPFGGVGSSLFLLCLGYAAYIPGMQAMNVVWLIESSLTLWNFSQIVIVLLLTLPLHRKATLLAKSTEK